MSIPAKRKYVLSYFMVGNTYPYTTEDWVEDISLANSVEIDGFVLNVGTEDWQFERSQQCFDAISQLGSQFRLSFSFDMTSIPSNGPGDIYIIKRYIERFGGHPNLLRIDGAILVSTFAGEGSLYGFSTINDAWTFVKTELQEVASIHFVPSFFIDPAMFPSLTCMDGAFNWNGGWPLHLHPRFPRKEVEYPSLDSDAPYLRNLGGRTFMAAVSPWFFTHYGPDSWNKNWIYRGDDWLFVRRWEQLIELREHIDIVQVLSWNDYGESHYMGPIKGAQPNSQAWVDNFPHEAWLHLNSYFARSFKLGYYDRIEKDEIFLWARPHPKSAEAAESVPRPDNWELASTVKFEKDSMDDEFSQTEDKIWSVVFATGPATIKIYCGDHSKSFNVKYGVSKLSLPMKPGCGMRAKMKRGRATVVECAPDVKEFFCVENPATYNFNVFVAKSHHS